jgi:hypothetical protein
MPGVHQLNGPVTGSGYTYLGRLTNLLADDFPFVCVVFFDRGQQRSALLACQ